MPPLMPKNSTWAPARFPLAFSSPALLSCSSLLPHPMPLLRPATPAVLPLPSMRPFQLTGCMHARVDLLLLHCYPSHMHEGLDIV